MKFREYVLESGRKIFLGKNAENNDELVRAAKRGDFLLHSAKPGSPFCNVGQDVEKTEVKEAAVVCACKSQDWRDNKKDVVVHIFKRSDMKKKKDMKVGTWGVGKFKKILIKKSEILKLKNG